MAHNAYIRSGGVWNNGTSVLSAEFGALDVAQFKAINGDDGGTWNPTNPLVIGGAGLTPTISDAAEVTYKTARTITRKYPFVPGAGGTGVVQPNMIVAGAASGTVINTRIEVPDGATITKIRTRVVIFTHVSLPTTYPGISVYRQDVANMGGQVRLLSTDLGLGQGAVLSTPANVAAYNALGNTFFDYVPNQNNVVDRSNYVYFIQVMDEGGGGAIFGNQYTGYEVTFTVPQVRVA